MDFDLDSVQNALGMGQDAPNTGASGGDSGGGSVLSDAWNTVSSGVGSAYDAAANTVNSVENSVAGAEQSAANAVGGAWDAVTGAAGSAASAVGDAWNTAQYKFSHGWGSSPNDPPPPMITVPVTPEDEERAHKMNEDADRAQAEQDAKADQIKKMAEGQGDVDKQNEDAAKAADPYLANNPNVYSNNQWKRDDALNAEADKKYAAAMAEWKKAEAADPEGHRHVPIPSRMDFYDQADKATRSGINR
jgi:hypothetical protein